MHWLLTIRLEMMSLVWLFILMYVNYFIGYLLTQEMSREETLKHSSNMSKLCHFLSSKSDRDVIWWAVWLWRTVHPLLYFPSCWSLPSRKPWFLLMVQHPPDPIVPCDPVSITCSVCKRPSYDCKVPGVSEVKFTHQKC